MQKFTMAPFLALTAFLAVMMFVITPAAFAAKVALPSNKEGAFVYTVEKFDEESGIPRDTLYGLLKPFVTEQLTMRRLLNATISINAMGNFIPGPASKGGGQHLLRPGEIVFVPFPKTIVRLEMVQAQMRRELRQIHEGDGASVPVLLTPEVVQDNILAGGEIVDAATGKIVGKFPANSAATAPGLAITAAPSASANAPVDTVAGDATSRAIGKAFDKFRLVFTVATILAGFLILMILTGVGVYLGVRYYLRAWRARAKKANPNVVGAAVTASPKNESLSDRAYRAFCTGGTDLQDDAVMGALTVGELVNRHQLNGVFAHGPQQLEDAIRVSHLADLADAIPGLAETPLPQAQEYLRDMLHGRKPPPLSAGTANIARAVEALSSSFNSFYRVVPLAVVTGVGRKALYRLPGNGEPVLIEGYFRAMRKHMERHPADANSSVLNDLILRGEAGKVVQLVPPQQQAAGD